MLVLSYLALTINMMKKSRYLYEPFIAWFEKYWFISLLIAIFFAGLIFYISSIPSSGFPGGLGIKTKIYHLGVYALLGFFVSIAVIRGKINTRNTKYLIIIAILLSIAYACSDEIHQFFVPGRHTTFRDVFIDSTGALIAVVFYYALRDN